MINAADLDPFFHPAMSPGATSPRDTAHLGGMLEVGLHFRNSCQHDHGLASLIFRSRSDLIAGQIECDAISLIGGRKMQRLPVDHDPSGAHAEKTAEIDHGSQYLSALIDQAIDDASQVLLGTAADLLAEHRLNALIGQDRLPRVLVVIGVRGDGWCCTRLMDFFGQGSPSGRRANARREDRGGKKITTHGPLPSDRYALNAKHRCRFPWGRENTGLRKTGFRIMSKLTAILADIRITTSRL